MLVRSGIILLKYWFSVSDEEQERRFRGRITDPTKRWKLSPMDLESRKKRTLRGWFGYDAVIRLGRDGESYVSGTMPIGFLQAFSIALISSVAAFPHPLSCMCSNYGSR